jgi:outer membrane protein assembly factor BamB
MALCPGPAFMKSESKLSHSKGQPSLSPNRRVVYTEYVMVILQQLASRRPAYTVLAALSLWLAAISPAGLFGQPIGPPFAPQLQFRIGASSTTFELSETVQLDRADGAVLTHMERAKACVAGRQWDEAVETLRQVMENAEGKLLEVAPGRYVNLSDACQMQLAALPPEALTLYRRRVDSIAQKWYQEGIAARDAKSLNKVVQQAFASSWGDKALMALGEIRLEEGDYAAARWCWERILPATPPAGEINAWPGYPDSALDPAAVRARLVLVSILEGSHDRARDELSQLVRLHGAARGRLGGHEVRYAAALADLLNQSSQWPKAGPGPDWPTFAGSPARNALAPECYDVAAVEWRAPLRHTAAAAIPPAPQDIPAVENTAGPLVYYPVFSEGKVFTGDQNQILGFRADSGRPAWGEGETAIYHETADIPQANQGAAVQGMVIQGMAVQGWAMPGAAESLATPRYTLTIADRRLYARIGSPFTGLAQLPGASAASDGLVCLDLQAEGKQLWQTPKEEGWAFDGAPVAAGARLFAAMRRNDIRPQVHVACFDATTGRMRWRRFVCAAETPAHGAMAECAQTLLTLAGGAIYVNTNLGAVASLDAENGRINWVRLYPRDRKGDFRHLDAHWQRDLNPCLFDHGRLFVAPADSPKVYALDAMTGQILWPVRRDDRPSEFPVQSPLGDVVDLLGVSGDCLIASGQKLYWIDIAGPHAGNIAHVWPEGDEKPGYGRGLLSGSYVLWPARDKIYVFHQQTARLKREIELGPLGVRGGNLLVAGGRLLIATPNELIALGTHSGSKKAPNAEITDKIRNPNDEIRNKSKFQISKF